ncbi:MAG: hypothetical protein JW755_11600 [Candidatus Aminicenantes bacterium]|nr:hypothetical protein [Candidatus Aminicenantes bacterium]
MAKSQAMGFLPRYGQSTERKSGKKINAKMLMVFLCLFVLSPIRLQANPAIERYVAVQTKNIWTQLLLDTKTGRVWQVSRTDDGQYVKLPINDVLLADVNESFNGRFRLNPTENIFNFVLIDSYTGNM